MSRGKLQSASAVVEEWGEQASVVAEHEAAHAIAYLALGYPVHVCDAVAGFTAQSTEPVLMDEYDHAVVSMAGVVIENRYKFQSIAERLADRLADDDASGTEHGDMDRCSPHLAVYGYTVAEILLDLHARDHRTLADAVAARGRLESVDIAALSLKVGRKRS